MDNLCDLEGVPTPPEPIGKVTANIYLEDGVFYVSVFVDGERDYNEALLSATELTAIDEVLELIPVERKNIRVLPW